MRLRSCFVEPEREIDPRHSQPASYVRATVEINEDVAHAELAVTACGMYRCYLNGSSVTTQVFLPGFTWYPKRLQYQSFDVTRMLRRGTNLVGVVLGDGWYRGKIGVFSKRNFYGERTKLAAALTVTLASGRVLELVSGPDWKATQDGPIRTSDWKDGEQYDARLELEGWLEPDYDDSAWHPVRPATYAGDLVPSEGEAILEHERFRPAVLATPDGSTVLDFGQNLFGYVEFTVHGTAGHTVRLAHGEVLDENGNFTLKNVSPPGLLATRTVLRQEIEYTLRDGQQTYKPHFTAHGFRYVKVSNWPEDVKPEHFESIAVYSDVRESGDFSCSNPILGQVVANTRWSQKGNFLDIPTDCPTRERAGWTGDIAAFVETGSYLMKIDRFLEKWLKDLALQQSSDGCVASIVPDVGLFRYMDGSAGWADAAVIVPYTLYRLYGDVNVLREQYESMQRWLDFVERRARRSGLFSRHRWSPHREFIVDSGYHWGEWLEPGHSMAWDAVRNTFLPDAEVATAYFAYSAGLLAEIAEVLDKAEDATRHADLSRRVKEAYRHAFTNDGLVDSDRQCRYVRPVALDLLSEADKRRNVARLAELVAGNDYRIGTGFLTTPHILPVLTDHGFAETAYRVALNRKRPGWLYEVEKGATTIWENWNGVDERGVPRDSHNHYAFGTIVGWLFSRVAGVTPLEPGFRKIRLRPMPGGGLAWAKCRYESAAGTIATSWTRENDEFRLEVDVPVVTRVELPDGSVETVRAGLHRFSCKG